jgi:hypothetical protein
MADLLDARLVGVVQSVYGPPGPGRKPFRHIATESAHSREG